MRLAGGLQSGRNSIERGSLRNRAGHVIGTYCWKDQILPPKV